MEKHEDVTSILSTINLDNIEKTIKEPDHQTGAGRPPRNPLGIFKALMIKQLSPSFSALQVYFEKVLKVKKMKQNDFTEYTKSVEEAYGAYMASEPYSEIQGFVTESLQKGKHSILFHEANACPDFWEQTRIVGGINIAESLLYCAQSLL